MIKTRQWSIANLPLIRPMGVASLIFLYLPLVTVLIFSFNESEDTTVWGGFSTKWYGTITQNTDLIRSAQVSLSIAIPCAIIAALLATGLAIGMGRATGKLQNIFRALVNAPLVLPEIVTAVATLALFSIVGVPLVYGSLLFAHVVICVPFAFMPIRSRLRDLDENIFEAARDLGAGSIRVMTKISIPLLVPALLSSGLLSFIISMDDFLTSLFVSGPETTTLPIYIFGLLRLGATPEVNVIAALLLIIPTLGLLVGITWTTTRRRSNEARHK
jgi:spermidine/putrescine transport system permease protein